MAARYRPRSSTALYGLRSTMTRPSRSDARDRALERARAPESKDIARLARGLLLLLPMVLAGACILPPPLEIGNADAGTSAKPTVEQVLPEDFATPGPPVKLTPGEDRIMTLVVHDEDVDDTIHVRFFVDYGDPDPTNFKADCTAAPSGEPERSVECNTRTLCDGITPDNSTEHFLEAVVADAEFLATSDPEAEDQLPFRAIPTTASKSTTTWTLICLES